MHAKRNCRIEDSSSLRTKLCSRRSQDCNPALAGAQRRKRKRRSEVCLLLLLLRTFAIARVALALARYRNNPSHFDLVSEF